MTISPTPPDPYVPRPMPGPALEASSAWREPAPAPILDARTTRRGILVAVAVVSLLGLAAEVVYALTARAPIAIVDALARMLSLSGEANVPTWFASLLLFACALAAAAIARETAGPQLVVPLSRGSAPDLVAAMSHAVSSTRVLRRGWWGTCAVFAFASLDEAVQLHEHLGGHFQFGSVLYFDWVIWAVAIVAILALAFWPFVRALPAITRTRLIVAGAIFLGGAVAMELPLGWYSDRHGVDGLGYALIDWLEETLEMIGATLALHALLAHRAEAAHAAA